MLFRSTASAAHRAGSLCELLAPFGTATLIEDAASSALWATIRDVGIGELRE